MVRKTSKYYIMGKSEFALLQKAIENPFFMWSYDGGLISYRSLKMSGFPIMRFKFRTLSRGRGTRNKDLELPHQGFSIFYLERDKFKAIYMIFKKYPKLLKSHKKWDIIRPIVGKENIKGGKHGVDVKHLKYRSKWMTLSMFVKYFGFGEEK